jgi:hypothetical protein
VSSSPEGNGSFRNGWEVQLECGHRLTVPFDSAAPFVLAYVLRHREVCSTEETPPLASGGWGGLWRVPEGVASH